MDIDELSTEYGIDAAIDTLNIEEEFRRCPVLHAKYLAFWATQNSRLSKYVNEYKRLKVIKHEFYSHGPSKEDRAKGLKLPPSGMILKANVPMYIDGDEEIIELQGKIDATQILVDALEKMVNYLAFRSKTLEGILAHRKFEAGA
jgi:hypothetical protein